MTAFFDRVLVYDVRDVKAGDILLCEDTGESYLAVGEIAERDVDGGFWIVVRTLTRPLDSNFKPGIECLNTYDFPDFCVLRYCP